MKTNTMIQIYHNPKCSKSREGLKLVQESGKEFEIRDYIKEGISVEELKSVLSKLRLQPIDIVRTKETLWKENYKDKTLNDDEILSILVENPKLIERPIVVNNQKAVVGRPPELINEILK